jgi:hypothetical protein
MTNSAPNFTSSLATTCHHCRHYDAPVITVHARRTMSDRWSAGFLSSGRMRELLAPYKALDPSFSMLAHHATPSLIDLDADKNTCAICELAHTTSPCKFIQTHRLCKRRCRKQRCEVIQGNNSSSSNSSGQRFPHQSSLRVVDFGLPGGDRLRGIGIATSAGSSHWLRVPADDGLTVKSFTSRH